MGIDLYFIPVETRVPLKFGRETLTTVTCLRICMKVEDADGKTASGWGETPLSVQWAWPADLSYQFRHDRMKDFSLLLAKSWAKFDCAGHPIEIGHQFIENQLGPLLKNFNSQNTDDKKNMPWLAALICCSAFDIAVHDAYGKVFQKPVYQTYTSEYMSRDLSAYLEPASDCDISFQGKYPCDFLTKEPALKMPAWHLVGGKDLIDKSQLVGSEPDDGYPVLLEDWIKQDGLKCLKIKLTGTDAKWDFDRLIRVGKIAIDHDVYWLTSDFNCMVTNPDYVNDILDRLKFDYPRIYQMILYVEQPFPYELEENKIDVHSVSARKPLFMDESAHNWRLVRLGRSLGWTGVALKTCKTQTSALLALCWAKAHGMTVMVQDLTNPMLAQIPHCLLAAYAGTIMGVETNGMQFYPEVSAPERGVHPGIYLRRQGQIDISSLQGPGFGYRLDEIDRRLTKCLLSC